MHTDVFSNTSGNPCVRHAPQRHYCPWRHILLPLLGVYFTDLETDLKYIFFRYWRENILKVIIGEWSKVYKSKKIDIEWLKVMHKYSQLKKFNHDRQLQVYMYNFMYVFPQKMPVEDHFPATKSFIVNYKKKCISRNRTKTLDCI